MTLLDWLPITKKETDLRRWDEVDIVFVTGDTLKPIHIQLTEKGTECGMNRYETALKNVIQTQEASYKEILSQLPMRQKPVLFAIAKEGLAVNVTSGAFVKRYGLGSSSSVQAALKGLLEKDLVTRTEKGYQVYDRFFSTWIRWYY